MMSFLAIQPVDCSEFNNAGGRHRLLEGMKGTDNQHVATRVQIRCQATLALHSVRDKNREGEY